MPRQDLPTLLLPAQAAAAPAELAKQLVPNVRFGDRSLYGCNLQRERSTHISQPWPRWRAANGRPPAG